MKRKWSTYGFIFLLLLVASTVLTCQCGDLGREHAAQMNQSSHCCHPMEREKAPAHPEKDCCGQCFSSTAMSAYLNRATFTLTASDALDACISVEQPETVKPYQIHTNIEEEGTSFFITHVFQTTYSSQAPPLA